LGKFQHTKSTFSKRQ